MSRGQSEAANANAHADANANEGPERVAAAGERQHGQASSAAAAVDDDAAALQAPERRQTNGPRETPGAASTTSRPARPVDAPPARLHMSADTDTDLEPDPKTTTTTATTPMAAGHRQADTGDEVRLQRSLGLVNGVSMIMGVIVGSGIFVAPKAVLENAGSVGSSLATWTLCGLFAMLGSLCYAELGTSVRKSGGEYAYIRLAYGPLPAFLYLWVTFTVLLPCGNAVCALTFAHYVLEPVYSAMLSAAASAGSEAARLAGCGQPAPPEAARLSAAAGGGPVPAGPQWLLAPNASSSAGDLVAAAAGALAAEPLAQPPAHVLRLVALALIMLLVYVNCVSVQGSTRLQDLFAGAKVFALALIISMGLYYIFTGRAAKTLGAPGAIWAGSKWEPAALASAFYAAFYTYSGWSTLNCVTEELRKPERNMPRAIILSITSITLIYILANLAYFAVLSPNDILSHDAIASILGAHLLGAHWRWLMPLTVAASTLGGLNGAIFAGSRILFAGARQGQLPGSLEMLNVHHLTPVPALLFLGATSTLFLITTDLQTLIGYMGLVEASLSTMGVSTVIALRYKFPELRRPFRVPTLVPIVYLTFALLLIGMPLITDLKQACTGLLLLLAGLPVYQLTANWKAKPHAYQWLVDKSNIVVQKLTLSVQPTPGAELAE